MTVETRPAFASDLDSLYQFHPPCAVLWHNGNAMFFGEDGKQIELMQGERWRGLHLFRERFPEAPVYVGVWNKWVERVPVGCEDYVLESLRKPNDSV